MNLILLSNCSHKDDGDGWCEHCGKWIGGWEGQDWDDDEDD